MLPVGRWQPETRERFPVFGTPLGQGGGRVFFGRPRLRQRDVAGPMYRGCMERWNALIDHVCRRRQLNREVVENLMCQARLAKARPSARSWGRETPIVNVGRISPIAEGESGSRFVLVTGGLYNFPVDFLDVARLRFWVLRSPVSTVVLIPSPPPRPPVCHGAGTLNCSRWKHFQKQPLQGSWAKHTCFARKTCRVRLSGGCTASPQTPSRGGREGVRVVSR